MPTRLLPILLLLALFSPACASQQQKDAQTVASIKQYITPLSSLTTPTRTIPIASGQGGTLAVYGNLDNPDRLQLTLNEPHSKLVNNFYFKDSVLVCATTQRFQNAYLNSSSGAVTSATAASYTYKVFFNNDEIIGRSSTGDPGNTASLEPEFPDRLLIDQLVKSTRASAIQIYTPPSQEPQAYQPTYPID
jgi:hypothetical protein